MAERNRYALIDEPPNVLLAIRFILRVHELVGMPHKINIQSGHEERSRGGSHQVQEAVHVMIVSQCFRMIRMKEVGYRMVPVNRQMRTQEKARTDEEKQSEEGHIRVIPSNRMLQHNLILRRIEETRLCPFKMRHLSYKASLPEDLHQIDIITKGRVEGGKGTHCTT
jgi:hypothetical protein